MRSERQELVPELDRLLRLRERQPLLVRLLALGQNTRDVDEAQEGVAGLALPYRCVRLSALTRPIGLEIPVRGWRLANGHTEHSPRIGAFGECQRALRG